MKILIYGAKGWIGSQYVEYLRKIGTDEIIIGQSRLDNDNELENEIMKYNPSHVVSFTGRTYGEYNGQMYNTIDYLENPGKLVDNIRDNLYGPMNLAILSDKLGFHYTYLGTGCIFEYDDEEHLYEQELNGFKPEDNPNFFGSSYSIVKGFTDRLMKKMHNVLNLRIRMPIIGEEHSRNFITKIVNYEKVCSIKNSMTVLPTMWNVVYKLMHDKTCITINLVNPGLISHNEILEIYREVIDPNKTWNNMTIDEQSKLLLAARSNNYLDTSYIEQYFPEVPRIHDAVRMVLNQNIL